MLPEKPVHDRRLLHAVSEIACVVFHAEVEGSGRNLIVMLVVMRETDKVHTRKTLRGNPNGQENRCNCDIVVVLEASSMVCVGKHRVGNI